MKRVMYALYDCVTLSVYAIIIIIDHSQTKGTHHYFREARPLF